MRQTRPGRTRRGRIPRQVRCRREPGSAPTGQGGNRPGATTGAKSSSELVVLGFLLLDLFDGFPRLQVLAGQSGVVGGIAVTAKERIPQRRRPASAPGVDEAVTHFLELLRLV